MVLTNKEKLFQCVQCNYTSQGHGAHLDPPPLPMYSYCTAGPLCLNVKLPRRQ